MFFACLNLLTLKQKPQFLYWTGKAITEFVMLYQSMDQVKMTVWALKHCKE